MDAKSKPKFRPHPQQKTNFLSDLFYCWTISIFRKGVKKELSEEDIYEILKRHDCKRLVKKLNTAWKEQTGRPSLWKAIWKTFKFDIIINMLFFFFMEIVVKMSRPIALGKLMGYYVPDQTHTTKNDATLFAFLIIIANFIDAVVGHFWMLHCQQLGIKVRVAVSSLIYRKSLKLSKKALTETTMGHVINLLSNDMQKLVAFWSTMNGLWGSPLEAICIICLMYYLAGPTALVGTVFIALLSPIQFFMGKKSAYYRLKIALKTDERVKYMGEIISAIQVIKMYTWEVPFIKLIDSIRRKEVYFIKISSYLGGITRAFSFFVNRTSIFLCVLTYVLTGNNPNAQYVFVLSSFHAMLMHSMTLYFPFAISSIFQTNVSIKRFESFLSLEETEKEKATGIGVGLQIEKATAKWCKESSCNTLTNINFSVEPGQVVAIIGPIGSGKSTLLQVCLKELPLLEGSMKIGGRISYANQEPWLFGGTIKQNILFGEVMDSVKYREVIKVCALIEDIAQFPYGDNTIVGERGILLSGGQKARINLARAVYRDADIYLLDDPLSAVDASVGKQIFNNCIIGYLKNKCTVLVTHQIQYLSSVDKIYLITNGTVVASGTYQDLQASGEDFAKLLQNTEKCEDDEVNPSEIITEVKNDKEQKETEESKKAGKVSRKVYMAYVRSAGTYFGGVLIMSLFIFTEIFSTGSDYFITFWVNLEQKRMSEVIEAKNNQSDLSFEDLYFSEENCIYIYSALIGGLIVFSLSCSLSFIKSCMQASIKFHNKMFTSIINGSMQFFYTNSSGRILNRFSKDVGCLDEVLPHIIIDIIQLSLSVLVTALAICVINPWTLIPTLIITFIMYLIQRIYLASSRSLQRMESTNRSPIFAHLTESMKGLTTIRAYDAEKILEKEFDNYQNVHTSVVYMNRCTNRAFGLWLDLICVMYVSIVSIIALTQETYGGNVGFVITQSMGLTGAFQWCIRRWGDLENQMTSVERVIEYTEISQEKDETIEKVEEKWPDQGKIEFKGVSMRYSQEDPYVLKNLNVIIKPKEKIGIVGRTGAGKSSLIAVLFRLINFEGNIFIDNVNTKNISLASLRSKISIIPQDPTLFSGTLRKNLDPFDQHQDEQIWNVLEEVQLKNFVADLPSGLCSSLSEGGSNFSVGQKQLICLARALLKDNKILMLDEATANVDPHTDELLQKTIRTSFQHCTVLTIAHRLHTVMDSDKVLVMENGCVAEFDHPHVLFQNKMVFYDLVMETGRKMSENLMKIARKNYDTCGNNNENRKIK